jgi:hypothetical protein
MCDKPLDFNDHEKVGGREGIGVKLVIGRFLEEGLIEFVRMELNNSEKGRDYLVGSGQMPSENNNGKQCDLIVVEKHTDKYYHCKIGDIIIPYQFDIIRLIVEVKTGIGKTEARNTIQDYKDSVGAGCPLIIFGVFEPIKETIENWKEDFKKEEEIGEKVMEHVHFIPYKCGISPNTKWEEEFRYLLKKYLKI